jgi:Psg1-like protein
MWNAGVFSPNTSILVGLQYNNNSGKVAYMSDPLPKERGLTLITIDQAWLDGWDKLNLTLFWVAYATGSDSNAAPKQLAYNITLIPKPVEHLPASIHSGKPSKESLLIALPIVFGFILLVLGVTCVGMRSHRKIGLGSIMGRGRRGYSSGKSRRQRLGIKKGAIRLEDREITPGSEYRDDEIAPAPEPWSSTPPRHAEGPFTQSGHARDLSLGSLVTDDSARNSFRNDLRH